MVGAVFYVGVGFMEDFRKSLGYCIINVNPSRTRTYHGVTLICDILAVKALQGNYTEWSEWSDCSTTCGNGEKYRTRNCTNPPPAFGGMDCSFIGMDRDVQTCQKRACAGRCYGFSVQHT